MRDDSKGVGTTIRYVANLHHVSFACTPPPPAIDYAGVFEHLNVVIVITMNVPNGDNTLYPLPVVLNCGRQPRQGHCNEGRRQ